MTKAVDVRLVRSFAEQRYGAVHKMVLNRLSGGLDSCGVYRVRLSLAAESGGTAEFVIKCLPECGRHEASIYRLLEPSSAAAFAPRLLGTATGCAGETYLFLEWIPPRRWPWRDQHATLAVIRRLCELHALPAGTFVGVRSDSYFEQEMQRSALWTAEIYDRAPFKDRSGLRPMSRVLQRIADDIIPIRRHLIQQTGTVPLHGDLHSGNVVIRNGGRYLDPVLLDWGRARLGSPLEDVASWLQSLAYWEPKVRRHHDTFLSHYLRGAGRPSRLIPEFRRLYWLAAASNAMAGALRYHLETLLNPVLPQETRARSRALAGDWLRIVRRADEYWRLGDGPDRQTAENENPFHQTALL